MERLKVWSRRGGVETGLYRLDDGQLVVVKSCDLPGSSGWIHLLSLVETLRLMAARWWSLSAPQDGFVPLREVDHQTGILKVQLEYVPGELLDRVPDDGFARLVRLLNCLHQMGRIHGDLKPNNIILTPQGHLVLTDFGYLQNAPERSSITLEYAAPELSGQVDGVVGPAADFYSLGILWQKLGGHSPDWLTRRLLAQHPSERYSSAHELLGDLEEGQPSRLPANFYERVPYVSRSEFEAHWRQFLLGPLQGQATWIGLGAKSGMGKTRFLGEMAQAFGWRLLWGACNPGRSQGFSALHQALGQLRPSDLKRHLDPFALQQLAAVFPSLRNLDPSLREVANFSGQGFTARIRQLLTQLLRSCSDPQCPIWIVIDDIQWADPETLRILEEFSQEQEGSWLLTLAYRSEEWSVSERLRLAANLQLPALKLAEAQVLGKVLRAESNLIGEAHAWSGGCPFYMLEILRQGPQVRALEAEIGLGRHTQHWLLERLRSLSAPCQRMLTILALQGRRFELEPLGEFESFGREVLDEAAAQQIIWLEGERGLFSHDQMREAVLSLSDDWQKEELHLRLARYWNSRRPRGEFYLQRMAFHLQQSSRPQRCLVYCLRAAQNDELEQQYGAAHGHLVEALKWHRSLELEIRCHGLEKALDLSVEAEQRLHACLDQWPERRLVISSYLGLCYYDAGRTTDAAELLSQVLPGLERQSDPLTIAFCAEGINKIGQLFFHANLKLSPSTWLFLARKARLGRDEDSKAAFWGTLIAASHHKLPSIFARVLRRLITPERMGFTTVLGRARFVGPVSSSLLGHPFENAFADEVTEVYRILLRAGTIDTHFGYMVQGFFRLMGGQMQLVKRESEEQILAARIRRDPLLVALSHHYYMLSHPEPPPNFRLEDVCFVKSDTLVATHQAVVATLYALHTGQFEIALDLCRKLDHPLFSLDECVVSAWHATLARTAAEALPRRAARRRESLLAEAESQVRRCLRRSHKFVLYHSQALREGAVLLALRGRARDSRAAFRAATKHTLDFRLPHQELLTRREWLRCARELDWAEVGGLERDCLRLCAQMDTPWLLPARSQLIPDMRGVARHAREVLAGTTLSPPQSSELLSLTPEWKDLWRNLGNQALRRKSQLDQIRSLQRMVEVSEQWLEQVWNSPFLGLAQSDQGGQKIRQNRYFVEDLPSKLVDVANSRWSVQVRTTPPHRPQVSRLQATEAAALEQRIQLLLPGPIRDLQPDLRETLAAYGCQSFPRHLSAYEETVLAKILRELLTNSERHSPAETVHLTCSDTETSILILLENRVTEQPGPTVVRHGQGHSYVFSRISEIGGQFEFSIREGWARAQVVLPKVGASERKLND